MPSCQRKCLATGSLPRLRVSAQGFKKSLYGRVLSIGKYFSGKDTVWKVCKSSRKRNKPPAQQATSSQFEACWPISGIKLSVYEATDLH
jgi:hypothetical protein